MREIDSILTSFEKIGIPAYDCSIWYDGKEIYRRYFGYRDYEHKSHLKGDELYFIYSCSKIVTAVAVLQLVEDGIISLENRLSDFFPEFPSSITLYHLMTMTSGLDYNRSTTRLAWSGFKSFDTVKSMRALALEPLCFKPGTDWMYGFSLDMMAALIEVVTKEKFSSYIKRVIFSPLGMVESSFDVKSIPDECICAQYRYDSENKIMIPCEKKIQNGFQLGPDYESGGAGCISSVNEFMRLLEAIRKYEILKTETVRLMTTNQLCQIPLKSFQQDQNDTRYGYGLGVGCPCGNPNWTCFGWGGAAGAFAAIDPVNKLSIFFVEHVLNRPNRYERREIYQAAKKLL